MTERLVGIKVSSDGKALVTDMRQSAQATADLGKQAEATAKSAETLGKKAEEAARGADNLGKAVEKTGQAAKATAPALDAVAEKTGKAAKAKEALGKASEQAGAGLKKTRTEAEGVAPPIEDLGKKSGTTEQRMRGLGNTSAATAQQMRQVAPQVTDIVTSLISGQSPFLVAIQQGGQLKDVFGGVGPAARALGGYIGGMVNPATLAAGAVAVLGAAWYAGVRQESEFSNQLLISGNSAGLTASQYMSVAAGLQGITGSRGGALEALQQMASQGRTSADNLKDFTALAMRMDDLVGKPVADTVKEFAALAGQPVEASLALNRVYNHLTASTYEQIKALQEQGRHTQAADMAQRAMHDALNERMPQVQRNMGWIEQAAKEIAKSFRGATSAVIGYMASLGRAPTTGESAETLRARISAMERERASSGEYGRQAIDVGLGKLREQLGYLTEVERLERRAATAAGDRADAVDATARFGKLVEGTLTQQDKLTRAIAQAEEDGAKAGKTREQIEKVITGLRKQYADKSGDTALNDAIGARLTAVRRGGDLEAIATREAVERVNAELRQGVRNRYEAIDEIAAIETRALQGEEGRLAQQIAIVSERKNNTRELAELQGQLALVRERIAVRGRKQQADIAAEREAREKAADASYAARRNEWQAETAAADRATQDRYDQAARQVTQFVQALADENEEREFQNSLMGKSGLEQAKLIELRRIALGLRQQERALERSNLTADEADAERARLREAAAEAAAKAETAVTVREWSRANAEIGESFYLVLTDQGEAAKRKLIDLFDSMVLKPTIMAMWNEGAGALSSFLGQGAGGSAGILGSIGNLGSMYGGAKTAMGWLGLGGGAAAASGGLGLAATTGSGLSLVGAGSAGGLAASTGTGLSLIGGTSGGLGLTAGTSALGTTVGTSAAVTGTAAGAGGMGAIGTALASIPVYGWIAMAAMALMSMEGGETRSGQRYNIDAQGGVTSPSGPSGGPIESEAAKQAAVGAATGIDSLLERLGSSARLSGFQAALESSGNDRGGVYAGGTLNTGMRFGESGEGSNYSGTLYELTSSRNVSPEEALGNYVVDLKQATIQALQAASGLIGPKAWTDREVDEPFSGEEIGSTRVQRAFYEATMTAAELAAAEAASDIPKVIRDQLRGIDAEALTDEQVSALLLSIETQVQAVSQFRAAVDLLPFANLRDLSFDAAHALIEVNGGLDAMSGKWATYLQEYFSETERHALATTNVTKALAEAGLQMPATRAGFRDLVEGQDLTTEAGRKAYATLLGLAGAFAQITPAAEAAQAGVVDEAKRQDLWIAALKLSGQEVEANTALRQRELSSLHAALVPMQRYIYALEDEAAARSALVQAQQAVTTAETQYRTALQAVADYIARAAQDVADAEAKIAEIRSAAAANVEAASTRVQTAEEGVRNAVQAIATALEEAADRVEQADSKIAEIRSAAAAAVTQAAGEVSQAEGNITATLQAIAQAVRNGAERLGAAEGKIAEIRAAAAQRVTELAGRLTAAQDRIQTALRGIASEVEASAQRATQAQEAVDAVRERVTEQYIAAQDAVATAQQRVAELAQQSAQQLQALRTSLSQFLASLGVTQLGGGSPESRYLAARAQFETTSAAARGGDQAAIAQIQDVITALLETSAAYNASGDGFVADRAAVEAVLLELIAAGQPGSGAPGAPAATDPAAAAQEQLQTALANLATAQDLVAQTGASTALSAQSLLEQYVATSAAQQAAQNAHTALLAQTAGVDLQQLQQGATVASLLAELAAGEVERLQVQQELAIAQDVATQIGAQTAQVQRDLLAEFVAAEAERSTAAAAYQLLLEQTAGIDLSVLEQTVAMTGLLEQLAAYEADKAIAQARLTSAQEVANTVGAGAVTAVRDLVAEFIAASAERDQALADYNLALDQTKDVNFAVLNNQQTIAQLLANLDSAYTELGTARQGLLDAQAVATAVGANATNTVRDLVAEFNAAQAEHTAALARHNEALEQTKDINFAMLDNQASLADLLGNLNTAATNLDLARVSLTAAEEALATAITNTATTAAAAGSDLVAGVYANVLGRTGSMAPTSGELNYWTTALAGTNGQETGVTSQNLVQRMVADAFQFEGDPVYGYVVDLLRAQGYKADGSHADGLANVPWDGYRALLHRGERVMTARDNEVFSSFNWDSWSRSMGGGGDPRMAAEVEGLRGDVRRLEAALEASGNHQAAVAADGHLETHRLLGSLVTATDEAPRRLARVLVGAR